MKIFILVILFMFSSLSWSQESDGPVAESFQHDVMKVGKNADITLKYTDPDNDKATSCKITSVRNIEVYKDCECTDGVCVVGIISKSEGRGGFTYQVTADDQKSQDATVAMTIESDIDIWVNILGVKGILFLIGLGVFVVAYMNSVILFGWIDNQTHGTRDYLLKKFEIMFIEIEPEKVTYALLFMSFGSAIITFTLFALLGKFPLAIFLGIIMLVVGWKIPKPLVDYFEAKRKKKYQIQMVDALNLMANGLRAGLTVPQSIGMVVDELPAPVSQEFNLVLQQAKIGVPLDEALENLKKRVYTEDNEMFVTSVNILRETGGNLAETFDTIVGVIRERVRLQLKIDTYVSSGKFQAYTIGSMPFIMIIMFGMGDPEYFPLLFGSFLGLLAVLVICGLVAFGMWVIFRIIDIKV